MRVVDAAVETVRPDGTASSVPVAKLHRLPGDTPEVETTLMPGELITAVTLPPPVPGVHVYRKVRDRASYTFATVSIAAVLVRDGSRIIAVRVAFGGLAPKPWRVVEAADAEIGRGVDATADIALAGARPTEHNAFKLPLVRRTLAAAFADAARS